MLKQRTKPAVFNNEALDSERVRDNFQKVTDFLRDSPVLKSKFEFLSLSIPLAVTNTKIPHSLGFKPLDYLVTSKSNDAVGFYIDFEKSSATELDVTTTGAVDVRMLIGRYEETDV